MVCAGAVIVRDSADTEGRATTGDRVTPPDESLDCRRLAPGRLHGRPEAHFSDGWGKCVPTKPHQQASGSLAPLPGTAALIQVNAFRSVCWLIVLAKPASPDAPIVEDNGGLRRPAVEIPLRGTCDGD